LCSFGKLGLSIWGKRQTRSLFGTNKKEAEVCKETKRELEKRKEELLGAGSSGRFLSIQDRSQRDKKMKETRTAWGTRGGRPY